MDETILPTRGGGMLTEGGAGEAALLRGVVWVQREKLFARWKERFCILTRDYLHCFKKGSTQLTECGPFLFKVCFMYFCQLLLIETYMPDHLSPPFLRSRCWLGGSKKPKYKNSKSTLHFLVAFYSLKTKNIGV